MNRICVPLAVVVAFCGCQGSPPARDTNSWPGEQVARSWKSAGLHAADLHHRQPRSHQHTRSAMHHG